MKKILDPKGSGTVATFPPGVMPQDFGTRLSAKEYVDLVAFLLTLKWPDELPALAFRAGGPRPRARLRDPPLRHPAPGAVERAHALHGDHLHGGADLRVLRPPLVAWLHLPDLVHPGAARAARAPPPAPGRPPPPHWLPRLPPRPRHA